jgi:hypothetical protein
MIKNLIIILSFIIVFLISPPESFTQTGTWHADVTIGPRMLFVAADTTSIINRINSNMLYLNLFKDIYSTVSLTSGDRYTMAQITKNAGFVYAINRKPLGNNIIPLTRQERDSLKKKVFNGFKNADISVSSFLNFNEWQYRAKEIISYCEAYDLLVGANVHPDTLWQNGADRIHEFVGNLYSGASNPLFHQNARYSNQRIIYAAALVAGAIAFNNIALADANRQPINWVSLGMFNIDKTLWDYQSTPGAESGYSEGTYYFTYAMKYAMPVFVALKNFLGDFTENFLGRSVRNPWFDPKYKILFDSITKLKLPDGKLTPIEDSYLNAMFPELAIMGNIPGNPYYYAWPLSSVNKNSLGGQLSEIYDLRADYICNATDFSNPPADWRPTQFLPGAGDICMRSSWDSSAIYMHLSGKHGRARNANSSLPSGHNHANETAFIIFAGGELLALHPGYYDYDHNVEIKWGDHYNLVLVDDQGPDSSLYLSATEQYVYGVDAFIKNYFSNAETDFAEIFTRYQKTDFRRSVLFPGRHYFIVTDQVKSNTTRKFTFQIQGNGLDSNATYLPDFQNKEAKWFAGNMVLKAKVIAQDGSETFTTIDRKHAPRYHVWEYHSAMYVNKIAFHTKFLSVLYPYHANETEPVMTEVSVTNGTGMVIESNGHHDFVGIKKDPGSIQYTDDPYGSLATDGRLLSSFYSTSSSYPYSLFFQEGQYLSTNSDTLFSANDTVSVYAQFDSLRVNGSILNKNSQTGSIFMKTMLVPQSVQGSNIANWTLHDDQIKIEFDSSYCEFLINFSPDSVVIGLTNPEYHLPDRFQLFQNYPNPFNPGTTIAFDLPEASQVTLKIYNVLGEEIITLVSDRLPAGSYSYDWSTPAGMASGVYLYRLKTDGYEKILKMVLLK